MSLVKQLEASVLLTMCLAANTPSTIAQQKAATTPKLMKTIDATNCKRETWIIWIFIVFCASPWMRKGGPGCVEPLFTLFIPKFNSFSERQHVFSYISGHPVCSHPGDSATDSTVRGKRNSYLQWFIMMYDVNNHMQQNRTENAAINCSGIH